MNRIALAALAAATVAFAGSSFAQQQTPDFSKVEEKVTDLGHNTYCWIEGQSGNMTLAAAKPFTDFDKQVGANEQQSTNFVRVIYNSLKPASAAPKT